MFPVSWETSSLTNKWIRWKEMKNLVSALSKHSAFIKMVIFKNRCCSWAPHIKSFCVFPALVKISRSSLSETQNPSPATQTESRAWPDIESVYCENDYGVRSPAIMYCNGPEGTSRCKVRHVHLLAARRAELQNRSITLPLLPTLQAQRFSTAEVTLDRSARALRF